MQENSGIDHQALLLNQFLNAQQLLTHYPFLQKLFAINWNKKLLVFEKVIEALNTFSNPKLLRFCLFVQNVILKAKYEPNNNISIKIYQAIEVQTKKRDLTINETNQIWKMQGLLLMNKNSSLQIKKLYEDIQIQMNAKSFSSKDSKIEIVKYLIMGLIENQIRDYRFFGDYSYKMSFLRNFTEFIQIIELTNDINIANKWLCLLKQLVGLIVTLDPEYFQFKLKQIFKIIQICLKYLEKFTKRIVLIVCQCVIKAVRHLTINLLQKVIKEIRKILTQINLFQQQSITRLWSQIVHCVITYERKQLTTEFTDELNSIFELFLETLFEQGKHFSISIKDLFCRSLRQYIGFIDNEHQSGFYLRILTKKQQTPTTSQVSKFLLLSLSCIYFKQLLSIRAQKYKNIPLSLNEKISKEISCCLKRLKKFYLQNSIEQFYYRIEQQCLALKIILYQVPNLICKQENASSDIFKSCLELMKKQKQNSIIIQRTIFQLLIDLNFREQKSGIFYKVAELQDIFYQLYQSQSIGFIKCFVFYISKTISKEVYSINLQHCVFLLENLLQKATKLIASVHQLNIFLQQACKLMKQLIKKSQDYHPTAVQQLFNICDKQLAKTNLPCFLQPIIALLQRFVEAKEIEKLLYAYDSKFVAIYMIYVNQPGYVIIQNLEKSSSDKENALKHQINKALLEYKFATIPFMHQQYETIKIALSLCYKQAHIPVNNEAFLGKHLFQLIVIIQNSISKLLNYYDKSFDFKVYGQIFLDSYKLLTLIRQKVSKFLLETTITEPSLQEIKHSGRLLKNMILLQKFLTFVLWMLMKNRTCGNNIEDKNINFTEAIVNNENSQIKALLWKLVIENRQSFWKFCVENKLDYLHPHSVKETVTMYLVLQLSLIQKKFTNNFIGIQQDYQNTMKKCAQLSNTQNGQWKVRIISSLLVFDVIRQ